MILREPSMDFTFLETYNITYHLFITFIHCRVDSKFAINLKENLILITILYWIWSRSRDSFVSQSRCSWFINSPQILVVSRFSAGCGFSTYSCLRQIQYCIWVLFPHKNHEQQKEWQRHGLCGIIHGISESFAEYSTSLPVALCLLPPLCAVSFQHRQHMFVHTHVVINYFARTPLHRHHDVSGG